MAQKRFASDDGANDDDQSKEKRIKSVPSFASVIGDVMMVKSFNGLCNELEPLLRRVVNEEVESGLRRAMRTMTRTPSLRIQAQEPTNLKLVFTNKCLPTKIFTCNKVVDTNGEPLQLVLVEQRGDQTMAPTILPYPIKVEIVVVDGDFPQSDCDVWTSDEFNRRVVKERAGRRPLLTKDVNYTMRDVSCVNIGEIEFTDNSSWIRCRRFRLGARVVAETNSHGVRILEALTEPFVVKDHRGELYQKHYPPKLEDEVWRLEKIGKDGKFHKRLEKEDIHTVQDLLKLAVIDQVALKTILGGGSTGISEKIWDSISKHARTCNLGNKLYISSGSNYTIVLDPICQILSIKIDGHIYSTSDLSMVVKNEVDGLIKNAYENWDSLQEVDKQQVNEIFHPSQGNMIGECSNQLHQSMMPDEIVVGEIIQVGDPIQVINNNNLELEFGGWETLTDQSAM